MINLRKSINRILVGLILVLIMTFHLITNAYIDYVINDTNFMFWIYPANIFFFYDLSIFMLYAVAFVLLLLIE